MKYSTSFGLYSEEHGNFFPKNLMLYLRRKSRKIRDEFRESLDPNTDSKTLNIEIIRQK
ncbi:hypothetical protein LEP1GSC047_1523 [Leptospira inadai serovar Lyme str. 10]|uniref:Uncharacterized protein n=1 Tax=Leptospira inadai serovar Lyme str. 10 TaxID=1049790 RepID=V6HGZ0_9LEPT|nr:hypothetical protein LEP1GSC047_1523 [Leptospira inadai serovar Lyme str. 10]